MTTATNEYSGPVVQTGYEFIGGEMIDAVIDLLQRLGLLDVIRYGGVIALAVFIFQRFTDRG